jgi:hypothetical protein
MSDGRIVEGLNTQEEARTRHPMTHPPVFHEEAGGCLLFLEAFVDYSRSDA